MNVTVVFIFLNLPDRKKMEGHPPPKPYSHKNPDNGNVTELPSVKPANANPIRVPLSSGADQRENNGWIVGKANPYS